MACWEPEPIETDAFIRKVRDRNIVIVLTRSRREVPDAYHIRLSRPESVPLSSGEKRLDGFSPERDRIGPGYQAIDAGPAKVDAD